MRHSSTVLIRGLVWHDEPLCGLQCCSVECSLWRKLAGCAIPRLCIAICLFVVVCCGLSWLFCGLRCCAMQWRGMLFWFCSLAMPFYCLAWLVVLCRGVTCLALFRGVACLAVLSCGGLPCCGVKWHVVLCLAWCGCAVAWRDVPWLGVPCSGVVVPWLGVLCHYVAWPWLVELWSGVACSGMSCHLMVGPGVVLS